MRRFVVVLAAAGLIALGGVSASAQTNTSEFNHSPEAQERGKSISITGRCDQTEELFVSVKEGAAGDGSYVFSKSFPATNRVSGTIEVPGDAPYGPYVITGVCRTGPHETFRKDAPFAVVEKVGATTTTTTTAPGATTTSSSTTSTTLADGPTTTTSVTADELPSEVEDSDTTQTTVDEFAGTRNEDDDSIGPLLLLVGVVPLLLAVGAIAFAMRRRGAPTETPAD